MSTERLTRSVAGERRDSWRRPLRAILLLIVGAAGVALALLASGHGGSHRVGPLTLSVNDFRKPLIYGSAACAAVLMLDWRRRTWRALALAGLVMIGLTGIVSYARAAMPIITDSDFAVGELYVELATRGRLLVGPYSRFGWHHPGPVDFYLIAPFYALSGRRAAVLYAVALAVNLAALVTVLWVVAKERHRWPLAVSVTAACVLFASRVPRFLASPWTAHVPVLPSLGFLVVSAAVASGRIELLPLMMLFGTFIAQTHVGFVPMVASVALFVLISLVRDPTTPTESLLRNLNRSAWMCAVLWLGPISDAVFHTGGNAAALWRFFWTETATSHSAWEALTNWSYGLTSVLRPDFTLPWGGHFDLTGLWWTVPCALGQLALLAVIARRDLKAGHRFDGNVALITLVASVIGLWGLTRIRGDILDHDLFRIAALGALNLGVFASALVKVWLNPASDRWQQRSYVPATACVLVLVAALGLGARDLEDLTAFERRRTDREAIVQGYDAIRAFLGVRPGSKAVFRMDDDRWYDAAGIILRLTQDGTAVTIEPAGAPILSEALVTTGADTVRITLANSALHEQLRSEPGNVVLFESRTLFVDATNIAAGTVR